MRRTGRLEVPSRVGQPELARKRVKPDDTLPEHRRQGESRGQVEEKPLDPLEVQLQEIAPVPRQIVQIEIDQDPEVWHEGDR